MSLILTDSLVLNSNTKSEFCYHVKVLRYRLAATLLHQLLLPKILSKISNTEADCILFASDLMISQISCVLVTSVKYSKKI